MGDPRAQLLENMVDKFCTNIGGKTRAMPVVRIIFQNQNCDPKNLTKNDLHGLVDNFTNILLDEQGAEAAINFQTEMDVRIKHLRN